MAYDLFATHKAPGPILIGCAGWSVPSAAGEHFPQQGSHLERFSRVFPAVEINTSFYRPHRPVTYARWRDSVPDDFQFSVKMPRTITHQLRLNNVDDELHRFLGEACHLEQKLGCLLVQLPPSLRYDAEVVAQFFAQLRAQTQAAVVCEPRHPTWFEPEAAATLAKFKVGYVLADPAVVPQALPAIDVGTHYIRLHGSPEIYHSAYSDAYLEQLAQDIDAHVRGGRRVWCIFDNTASGAAVPNALSLMARVGIHRS